MVFLIRQSNSKINCMIIRKITCLSLLSLLFVVSCNKSETKSGQLKTDSGVSAQPVKKIQDSAEIPVSETYGENKEDTGMKTPKAEVPKNSVEGKFTASACDGGRFSIEFKNTDGKPVFKIFDKGKVIAAGNVSMETDEKTGEITEIDMGDIGGLYEGDKIIIQNYGNVMNEFDHFTQCGDKYLEFTKSK